MLTFAVAAYEVQVQKEADVDCIFADEAELLSALVVVPCPNVAIRNITGIRRVGSRSLLGRVVAYGETLFLAGFGLCVQKVAQRGEPDACALGRDILGADRRAQLKDDFSVYGIRGNVVLS